MTDKVTKPSKAIIASFENGSTKQLKAEGYLTRHQDASILINHVKYLKSIHITFSQPISNIKTKSGKGDFALLPVKLVSQSYDR